MSCRAVKKWIWRNGTDNISASMSRHIANCPECSRLLAEVSVLDQSVGAEPVPDPGEAYWLAFGERLARRIDEQPQDYIELAPDRPWRAWVRRWTPVVGIAALAVIMGRAVVNEYSPVDESQPNEVAVEAPKPEISDDAMPAATGTASETSGERLAVTQPQMAQNTPIGSDESAPASAETGASAKPADLAAGSGNQQPVEKRAKDQREFAMGDRQTDAHSTRDSQVWPERQVISLGRIDTDTPSLKEDDQPRWTTQETYGTYERFMARAGSGTETAGVEPIPGRLLEGPRHLTRSGLDEVRTPNEAMRIFDQVTGLRAEIGEIQAIPTAEQTAEQRARLGQLWFKVGSIATQAVLVDSAITFVGDYLKTLPEAERADWQVRHRQLLDRRTEGNLE